MEVGIKTAIRNEALRIEEDSLHSMKGHFNAAHRWGKAHLFLGIPATVLAGLAGVDIFSECQLLTSILAMTAAAIIAVITFLKPQSISENHRNAGAEYNKLKNKTRRFREIELPDLDDENAKSAINELAEQRDALNSMSPDIPRWAYEKAKKDIDEGLADYRVDVEKK